MSNTSIKLKKSSVSGKIPLVSDIDYGELAINYADGKLYYKHSDTSIRSFLDSGQILYLIDSDYLKSIINSTYLIANRPINLLEDSNPALANNLNLNGHNITDSGTSGSITMSGNITGGTITATSDFISTAAWDATAGGGQLYLNGATGNRIDFNTNGVAGPSYTTRSTGTKLLLYPALSGVQVDYAMGISPATMWSSVPVNDSAFSFKWYGGDINVASLTGTGNFTSSGTITASQVISTSNNTGQNFKIGDDAWIGDINVANTARISGGQDATQGYIVFGNSNDIALGRSGTGPLTYGGIFSAVELTSTNASGDEGGQINLSIPVTNTTLGGTVTVDVYQNKLRFFEGSVNAKGAYIDLSACANGVGTNLLTGGAGDLFDSAAANSVLDSATANGTGLTYSNGTISIANTGVVAGTYGSASLVPVFTINAQGQIDSAGTVSVAGVSNTSWDSTNGYLIINTADGGSYYTTITLDPYTTSDLAEGTNKYYTSVRADSDARNAITGSTGISYSPSTGVITSNDGQIVHDNLSGFVSNEHIDHSAVTLTAGVGLNGGGDLTTSRTFNIDSAELYANFSHDAFKDFVSNEHIDHTSVTITAGSGLTGGGDISTSRTINIGQGTGITVSADAIATNDAQIVHDNLSGFVANEHIDHSTVTLTAGVGLNGGGTIAASRTFNIDSAELYANFSHDAFKDFVSNEHIDHSSVSIIAGNGLTGGGTIAASRTLSIDSSQIKGLFSAGTGVTYNSGTGSISIGQAIGTGNTPTFTGLSAGSSRITSVATPSASTDAANKGYVDEVAQGLKAAPSVEVATTANLSATYNNGTLGVGATLTSTTNGAFPTIDGVTVATTTPGDNGVLVKNQTSALQNGRYNLTQVGNGSTPWILTRCGVCDQSSEIPGSYVFVTGGSTQANTGWTAYVANTSTFTVGTDNITYFQFSGAGTYTAGSGLKLTGSVFSIDSATPAPLATKLANARTIAISGDITGTATSFDGSASITITSAITSGSIVNADINASAAIADTKLATISTAGKVSNSATTATNANTANAIVARDASGNFTAGTVTAALSGNATTATNLSTNRTNWSTNGTITAVVGQLGWKNYTNNHTIFDASAGTAPDGTGVSNTDAISPWAPTQPTLMGWDGTSTYGVRVDAARISGSTSGNAATATTLQTARTIGGVSFNGSANIDLPGVNTTGNQNTSGTAAGITGYSGTYWTSNNDGAASGLDADLLDGQHGSYYRINVYNSSGTLLN